MNRVYEVDPNDWTEYPGVSVNRKTPSQETGKRERPPPLAGLLGGEEAGHKKIRQLTAIA